MPLWQDEALRANGNPVQIYREPGRRDRRDFTYPPVVNGYDWPLHGVITVVVPAITVLLRMCPEWHGAYANGVTSGVSKRA